MIEKLYLTQDGFRLSPAEIGQMIQFIKDGGRFNRESIAKYDPNRTTIIAITEFPDGNLFLRDGMHRVASIFLAGRDLFEDEFEIEKMTYEMYINPSVENGWVTPFDPRLEVRKADFKTFKQALKSLEPDQVVDFIKKNKKMYALPRSFKHRSIEFFANDIAGVLA